MKKKAASSIRSIFNALNKEEAERLLNNAILQYKQEAPKLSIWMEENIREGFTIFGFPEEHQKRLRTSNISERLNKDIKKRTRVASIFPNEASCLRLVTGVIMEISDEWVKGQVYLKKE